MTKELMWGQFVVKRELLRPGCVGDFYPALRDVGNYQAYCNPYSTGAIGGLPAESSRWFALKAARAWIDALPEEVTLQRGSFSLDFGSISIDVGKVTIC